VTPDPALQSMTSRYKRLYEEDQETSVANARVLGEILLAGADWLGARPYGRWVRVDLCTPKTTAARFRDVAVLYREDRKLFERNVLLGTTKLARLARVRPEARERALSEAKAPLCSLDVGAFELAPRVRVRSTLT
jgi:hypothetical protein